MSGEYQLRKDIDKALVLIESLEQVMEESEVSSIKELFEHYYDKSETDDLIYNQIDVIYPIGSVYISVSETNPAELFTGTEWEKIEGRFLLGSGDLTDEQDNVLDSYSLGEEDGEHQHTLTVNEMPSHTHTPELPIWNDGDVVYELSNHVIWGYHNTSQINLLNSTGGSQAHNNMPPYLAVNIWQRTA